MSCLVANVIDINLIARIERTKGHPTFLNTQTRHRQTMLTSDLLQNIDWDIAVACSKQCQWSNIYRLKVLRNTPKLDKEILYYYYYIIYNTYNECKVNECMFNEKIPALFMQVSRVDQIILIYDLFYFFLTPANL